MISLKQPLYNAFSVAHGEITLAFNYSWFRQDTKIVDSECGSADRETVSLIASQIEENARRKVSPSSLLLILRGSNSSHKSPKCFNICEEHIIVALRLPANTDHIFQACDESTNQTFQKAALFTRHKILSMSHMT